MESVVTDFNNTLPAWDWIVQLKAPVCTVEVSREKVSINEFSLQMILPRSHCAREKKSKIRQAYWASYMWSNVRGDNTSEPVIDLGRWCSPNKSVICSSSQNSGSQMRYDLNTSAPSGVFLLRASYQMLSFHLCIFQYATTTPLPQCKIVFIICFSSFLGPCCRWQLS